MALQDIAIAYQEGAETEECEDLMDLPEGQRDGIAVLEAKADTSQGSLTWLGMVVPNVAKLRLSGSRIERVRDVGCALRGLRYLVLSRCGLRDLNGIGSISPVLQELYLAFNAISDVCDLMGMDRLRVIDLEENQIGTLDAVALLGLCPSLRALTLVGNPAASEVGYRGRVEKMLPSLLFLDEMRLKPKARMPVVTSVPDDEGVMTEAQREEVEGSMRVALMETRPPKAWFGPMLGTEPKVVKPKAAGRMSSRRERAGGLRLMPDRYGD